MIRSATFALVLATLAACADGPQPAPESQERDYITGSNIPRRAGSGPATVEKVKGQDVERLRDDIMRTQPNPNPEPPR